MKATYLLACACLLMLSCSDDSNPTDTPEAIVASEYYPIESGATWTSVRTEGEERDTSSTVVSGPSSQMIGSKNEQVYTFTDTPSGKTGNHYFSDGGLYQVLLPYSEDFLVLPNGVEAGDTWTNVLEDENDYEFTCVSVSKNRTIMASDNTAASFEAVVEISFQKSDFGTATVYYAKGIGPVLTIVSQGTSTSEVKTIAHNGQEIVWE